MAKNNLPSIGDKYDAEELRSMREELERPVPKTYGKFKPQIVESATADFDPACDVLKSLYSATGESEINLQPASLMIGRMIWVIDGGRNASVNNITLLCPDDIKGGAGFVMDQDSMAICLWSDGVEWEVLGIA